MTLQQAAAVLRVSPLASKEDVKAAFRRRARETHPDVTKGDDTEFKRVSEANEVFEKHFERQARGAGAEEGSLLGRKLRASGAHVQRRVDRPYYGGEVNWPSLSLQVGGDQELCRHRAPLRRAGGSAGEQYLYNYALLSAGGG